MNHDGAADSIHVTLAAADAAQVVAASVLLEVSYSVQVRAPVAAGHLCQLRGPECPVLDALVVQLPAITMLLRRVGMSDLQLLWWWRALRTVGPKWLAWGCSSRRKRLQAEVDLAMRGLVHVEHSSATPGMGLAVTGRLELRQQGALRAGARRRLYDQPILFSQNATDPYELVRAGLARNMCGQRVSGTSAHSKSACTVERTVGANATLEVRYQWLGVCAGPQAAVRHTCCTGRVPAAQRNDGATRSEQGLEGTTKAIVSALPTIAAACHSCTRLCCAECCSTHFKRQPRHCVRRTLAGLLCLAAEHVRGFRRLERGRSL